MLHLVGKESEEADGVAEVEDSVRRGGVPLSSSLSVEGVLA